MKKLYSFLLACLISFPVYADVELEWMPSLIRENKVKMTIQEVKGYQLFSNGIPFGPFLPANVLSMKIPPCVVNQWSIKELDTLGQWSRMSDVIENPIDTELCTPKPSVAIPPVLKGSIK